MNHPSSRAQGDLKVVYVFIPRHVRRAIGSMRVASGWGSRFPNCVPQEDDELLRDRDFTSGRPWRSRWYRLASKEAILLVKRRAYIENVVFKPLWQCRGVSGFIASEIDRHVLVSRISYSRNNALSHLGIDDPWQVA